MKQVPQWYHLGEKGSRWGITFMLWAYRTFGRRVAAALLYPIVAYFFLRNARERRASLEYFQRLRATYPDAMPGGEAPTWRNAYRHFLEFARMILDRPAIITGETRGYVFSRHGQDLLERLTREKRGAILLSAHLGSLDIMRILAEKGGLVVNALMFRGNSQNVSAGLKPLYGEGDIRIVEHDPSSVQSVFELQKCVQRGEMIALNIDRVGPNREEKRSRVSWIPFLGQEAAFPRSPLILASLLECPVLLTFGLRTGDRTYELYAEEFADRIVLPRASREAQLDRLLLRYAQRLEFYCRKAPYQWFNFYDFWGGRI
jgi:predicted LPLAT superfamily acyltransferase